jgi:Flp pilus assembly protein CpaB
MFVRWSRPSRLYLWSGIALAVAGLLLMHSYLARVAQASQPRAMVPVVVAGRDVARGTALGASDLRVVRMPAVYAPVGALRTIAQASGRVALSDLAHGEAVTRTRLARVRAGPVASLIPEGLRAFAVPSSLPPGAVQAGDMVDVLATYSSGQPRTETVVTGVQVLFVLGASGIQSGQAAAGSAGGGQGSGAADGGALDAQASGIAEPGTLILLVSRDQDGRLAFARAFADLSIAVEPAGGPTSP